MRKTHVSHGLHVSYRPPPAHAQAQPAQAQAQAQEEEPPLPLLHPLLPDDEVGLGTGLVFWVILFVKSVMLPTTLLEKLEIPVAMEAAKSPPGRFGRAPPPVVRLDGVADFGELGPEVVVLE